MFDNLIKILEVHGSNAAKYLPDFQDIIKKADKNGTTLLMYAIREEKTEAIEALKQHLTPQDYAAKNNDGNTALHYAAMYSDDMELVAMTCDSNAMYVKNNKGETPLVRAVLARNTEAAQRILSCTPIEFREKSITSKDNSGKNCLFHACDQQCVHFLINIIDQYGLQLLNETMDSGDTLFLYALKTIIPPSNVLKNFFEFYLLCHKNEQTGESVLALANNNEELMDALRQYLTNEYFIKQRNPLIKMYMRFINTQTLEGSRAAQLNHFTKLINGFRLTTNDSSYSDTINANKFEPAKFSFWGKSNLYANYMAQLSSAEETDLQDWYGEFKHFHELMKEVLEINNKKPDEEKLIGSGVFMTKNWKETVNKVDSILYPEGSLRPHTGQFF